MPDFAEPLARLIDALKHLPGIGQKSAQRIAFHVLRAGREDAEHLAQALLDVKDKLGLCRLCNNISDSDLCLYCRDAARDPKVVCVVEEPIAGKGPLGGILSGLMLSEADENFVLACDMPFIKREAVAFVLAGLRDYDACLPATPKGLEPLHAAYRKSCLPAIESRLAAGNLRVTGFLERVRVNYVPWERLLQFDSTGRLLTNINEPGDMRRVSTDER